MKTEHRSVKAKQAGRSDAAAVEDYLAALPEHVRAGLFKLREAIAAAAPGAELGISYGIPAFRLAGRPLVWFAAFRDHSSFFPGATAIRLHRRDLKDYRTSKGTVQFPADQPPPASLIAKLVKTRIAELQKSSGRRRRLPAAKKAKARKSTTKQR